MKRFIIILASVLLLASPCFAMQGDIDNNGKVGLQDAVLGLQVTAGLRTSGFSIEADVNNDGNIGLPEVIYVLKVIAGIKAGKARAVLGPLSGATAKVYRINDMNTAIYTTLTDSSGYFQTALLTTSDYVVVAVSGGTDTDADDDGVSGDTLQNTGTIYALMTSTQFTAGNFIVSAITDIAYQYSKNLIGQADSSWLKTRLDDLAKNFFIADLNGDGAIDAKDLLMFVPTDSTHKSKLNFDYQQLFAKDSATSLSIMDCYHANNQTCIISLLDSKFGSRLSLNPAPDTRYQKVRIEVAAFGKGSVKSDVGGIDIDSARTNAADNVKYAFFDPSATGKVTLTATPATDTQILSWNGCDTVSQDKTKCESNLRADRLITVSFGYKETKLRDGVVLVDLTNAAVTISPDLVTLNVSVSAGDTDMALKLAALKAGDIVVGSAGSGFLRKVVSVQKVSESNYILTTADAAIGDVISQGTGGFYKQMTHGDLAPDSYTRSRRDNNAVRLLPSDDPNDKVFRLVIGNPQNTRENIEGSLELKTPGGVTIGSVKGTVDISIELDADISFHWFELEYFKFIPKVTATESVELTLGAEIEAGSNNPLFEEKLPSLRFGKIPFQIGPLPVWIEPVVKLSFGLEGKISKGISFGIKLNESMKAGPVYHKATGWDLIKTPQMSYEPIMPKVTALSGELKLYVKVTPETLFYSTTGPAIPMKGYIKFVGTADAALFKNTCNDTDGVSAAIYAGFETAFKWEIEHIEKILGKLKLEEKLEFQLWDSEWLLYRKNFGGGFCDAPYMEVNGTDINASVPQNSGQIISQTYTVKNTGKTEMDWDITYIYDGVTTVTPASGKLPGLQFVPVTVSVNTGKLSNFVGTYRNPLNFNNKFEAGIFKDQPTGSTSRMVTVTVTETTALAAPVMAQPQMAKTSSGSVIPTIVNLSWSYPDASTAGYVSGYVIYMTTDPNNAAGWQRLYTTTTPITAFQVSNLQTNTMYYFRMQAYGNNISGAMSGVVSVKTPQAGGVVSLPTFTNSLGMTFKLIPAGTFMMGSPADEPGRQDKETQHQVTLTKSFYIQTTEVTQGQWKAIMGSNPSNYPNCGDNCPVEKVSWNDAQTFIQKLNQQEGTIKYRLPTEAEWEYAARAGSTTAFANGGLTILYCGANDPNLDAMGWYCSNAGSTIHPVAQKQPNTWGLYDMHGNVFEWVYDWYSSYPNQAVIDPNGPLTGSEKVFRGGSISNYTGSEGSRSAYRDRDAPYSNEPFIGFRLVREQ